VNAQPFSESEKAALVEEANLVFRYNIAIFEELEGMCVCGEGGGHEGV
jgi:heme oxygenase